MLKISAIASSVYISIIITGAPTRNMSGEIGRQFMGFAILFFISMLVYLVL